MIDLKKISKEQLLEGMNLALKNARSLLKEAELLVHHNAYARAFALGTLSIEEVGKVVFLTMSFHRDFLEAKKKDVDKFWKWYSSHRAKVDFFEHFYLRKWKSVLYVHKRKHNTKSEGDSESFRRFMNKIGTIYSYMGEVRVSSISELKLKCFYSDIDRKTLKFCTPPHVPKKVVQALLFLTKSHIRDGENLRNVFRRAKSDRISEEIMVEMFKSTGIVELGKLARELSLAYDK